MINVLQHKQIKYLICNFAILKNTYFWHFIKLNCFVSIFKRFKNFLDSVEFTSILDCSHLVVFGKQILFHSDFLFAQEGRLLRAPNKSNIFQIVHSSKTWPKMFYWKKKKKLYIVINKSSTDPYFLWMSHNEVCTNFFVDWK